MFACAHPAIERGMRPPLILQTILGLTAADIAAAFLIPPATMGQRLVRAKARIRETGVPFRIPEREEVPERLDAVLEAIYGAYSKAWGEIAEAASTALAGEAIWLARLIVGLLPNEPEARGMLALMLYTEARRPARRRPAPRRRRQLAGNRRPLRPPAGAHRLAGRRPQPRRCAGRGARPAGRHRRPRRRGRRQAAGRLPALLGHPRTPARPCGRTSEAREALTLAIGLSSDPAVRDYLRGRIGALTDG